MNEIQDSSAFFFIPTAMAYLLACGGWFAIAKSGRSWWPDEEWPTSDRRWLDLGLVLALAVGILLLGQAYREGWLLPSPNGNVLKALIWNINNLIIYAPLFVILVVRRQHLRTVFLSQKGLRNKIAAGFILGIASVLFFLTLRGELSRLPQILVSAISLHSLSNFFPVFLEGVAIAFLFVRLKWVAGLWPAIVIPSLLFALSHVPGSIEEGRSFAYIAAFFLFNTGLTCAILYTIQRSRDIIWLGIVHYLMDIAIAAF